MHFDLIFFTLLTYDQTDTSKSSVYIFRATGYTGSARQFKVFMDGGLLCKLKNDKYVVVEISSGNHFFASQMDGQTLKENTEKVEIMAEPGKSYYLSSVLETGALWSSAHFDELSENGARTRMMKLERTDCEK